MPSFAGAITLLENMEIDWNFVVQGMMEISGSIFIAEPPAGGLGRDCFLGFEEPEISLGGW